MFHLHVCVHNFILLYSIAILLWDIGGPRVNLFILCSCPKENKRHLRNFQVAPQYLTYWVLNLVFDWLASRDKFKFICLIYLKLI